MAFFPFFLFSTLCNQQSEIIKLQGGIESVLPTELVGAYHVLNTP